MIGRLHGTLLEKQPPQLLLDVHGVGYELEASMSTFYQLPEVGAEVVLHTHMVVREDAQLLYGFASLAERGLFRHLIRINGVGPKLALTILSGMNSDEFHRCIGDGDTAALVRLPGVGKKTAERLVVELKDRLELAGSGGEAMPSPAASRQPDPVSDAVSALISLGYKAQQASRTVRALDVDGLGAEDIIRLALKSMQA